jgi:hypothetical protein
MHPSRQHWRNRPRRIPPRPEPPYEVSWWAADHPGADAHAHAYRVGTDWLRSRCRVVRWTTRSVPATDQPRCEDCLAAVAKEA